MRAHASREEAKKNWDALRAEPEWKKGAGESEVNGKILAKVDSVFMEAADYSPIKESGVQSPYRFSARRVIL